MTRSRQWLRAFYVLIALAALIATWSQNLAYFGAGGGTDAFARFIEDTRVNPASRSITVDVGFMLMAAVAFMVIEARRLGVRFVWFYVVLGFLVAISVTFPLFMAAREGRLASARDSDWTLTASDLLGLFVVGLLVAGLTLHVLSP